jgi:hypothetical protein
MVLITGNWRIAMAGLAASLLIFGVLFFTVIKPSENTANQAVKAGLQQGQRALDQAQKQLASPTSPAAPAAAATSSAASTAASQVSKAAKLASCLTQAGIDTSKIQACQASYGH